jgi:hypothetical protein
MSSVAEIEAAIEKLPVPQVDQLASWLADFCRQRTSPPSVESWLQSARGAAINGADTQEIMRFTRGEE